jgi:hypothetical protein
MTLKEIIQTLELIRADYGDDIKSVVSIDTDDAFNVASCFDIGVFTSKDGEHTLSFNGSLETAFLEDLEEQD